MIVPTYIYRKKNIICPYFTPPPPIEDTFFIMAPIYGYPFTILPCVRKIIYVENVNMYIGIYIHISYNRSI